MVYKKLFFYSVFLFFCFSSFLSYSHAVYVSVCNVYQKNERSFFSMRAFKDDIFDALGFVGYSNELTEKQKIGMLRTLIDRLAQWTNIELSDDVLHWRKQN